MGLGPTPTAAALAAAAGALTLPLVAATTSLSAAAGAAAASTGVDSIGTASSPASVCSIVTASCSDRPPLPALTRARKGTSRVIGEVPAASRACFKRSREAGAHSRAAAWALEVLASLSLWAGEAAAEGCGTWEACPATIGDVSSISKPLCAGRERVHHKKLLSHSSFAIKKKPPTCSSRLSRSLDEPKSLHQSAGDNFLNLAQMGRSALVATHQCRYPLGKRNCAASALGKNQEAWRKACRPFTAGCVPCLSSSLSWLNNSLYYIFLLF